MNDPKRSSRKINISPCLLNASLAVTVESAHMADFYQHGTIATLHRLGNPDYQRLEDELNCIAQDFPLALVLPCHARDLKSDALGAILAELRDARFISDVTVGLDGADRDDFDLACRMFAILPQRITILWNAGPRITALLDELEAAGLEPGPIGKGRNMRLCLCHTLANSKAKAIAIHDCDILHYKRELLVRLCFPVMHPDMSFHVSKGFSARFSTQLNGRVMRLLITPLLQAMERVEGFSQTLLPLQFFRYPISGEVCLHSSVAESVRFPSDWGVETGMMADVFRVSPMKKICQVDIAESYDHKHQSLSEGDPDTGLNKMACDVALCLLRTAAAGIAPSSASPFANLAGNYQSAASGMLPFYAADARINTLCYDAELEKRTVELFAASVARAVEIQRTHPHKPAGSPSCKEIEQTIPGFGLALVEAARQDAFNGKTGL